MGAQLFPTVNIGGKDVCIVMNASGIFKTPESIESLLKLEGPRANCLGSYTWEERSGNTGSTFHDGGIFSLNSLGLPNGGREFLKKEFRGMVERGEQAGKSTFGSWAGFSPEDYARGAYLLLEQRAHFVILNLGCPNVFGQDKSQKPIASFNPDLIATILEQVRQAIGNVRIGVKLSPFSDPGQLAQVAGVLKEYKSLVEVIFTSNTFPNACAFNDDGTPVITPGGGLAGYAGPGFLPIGLGQVMQLRKLLQETEIKIVGVGGVSKGEHVRDYLAAGAVAVKVASALYRDISRAPETLDRIIAEYLALKVAS
jgi:dihydroorotate dehydrogenase